VLKACWFSGNSTIGNVNNAMASVLLSLMLIQDV
jgi:hypothetical protein